MKTCIEDLIDCKSIVYLRGNRVDIPLPNLFIDSGRNKVVAVSETPLDLPLALAAYMTTRKLLPGGRRLAVNDGQALVMLARSLC